MDFDKLLLCMGFTVIMVLLMIFGYWVVYGPQVPMVKAELEYVTVNGKRFKRVDKDSPGKFKAEVNELDTRR